MSCAFFNTTFEVCVLDYTHYLGTYQLVIYDVREKNVTGMSVVTSLVENRCETAGPPLTAMSNMVVGSRLIVPDCRSGLTSITLRSTELCSFQNAAKLVS